MSVINIDNPIFDMVYPIQAWEDNNRTLKLVQGEGVTIPDNATASTTIQASRAKAPRFQLKSKQGAIDLSSGSPSITWAVRRPNNGGEDLLTCNIVSGKAAEGIIEIPITTSVTEFAGDAYGEIRVVTSTAVIKFFGINACIGNGVSNEAASQSSRYDALLDALQQVVVLNNNSDKIATMDALVNGELPNGTNPVSSGNLKIVLSHYEQYQSINSLSALNSLNTPLDPQTIYRFAGQGIILGASDDDEEAQYYFAQDGRLRYRARKKVNGEWEEWGDTPFTVIETQANRTAVIGTESTNNQYPTAKAVYDNTVLFKYVVPNSTDNADMPANSVRLNDAIDPKVVYRYYASGIIQGLIIPAVTSTQQTQYYFAQDGIMRYRFRKKVNNEWEDWEAGDRFKSMVTQDSLSQSFNENLSPQNRLDKYFVRTCIDKSSVKLTPETQILGFGDSIMATSDGGSWMEIIKNRIGCPNPINMAVGGAQFVIDASSKLLSTQLSTFTTRVDNNQIDASTIDLIIVAAGTNDAYNGTPINSFQTAASSFFTSLQSAFTSRGLTCPPVLVITPIRRGKNSEINAAGDDNIELKMARYGAVLNNLALQNYFSVLNGFDIPVLVDNVTVNGVASETATLTSLMLTSTNGGTSWDDILHVHPNSTSGRATYAQAVLNAIGFEVDTSTSVFSYTLSANSWTGSAGSKHQAITAPAGYIAYMDVSADVTIDTTAYNQLMVDGCSGITISATRSGTTLSLTAYAYGNTPTDDIDIQVTLIPVSDITPQGGGD